MIRDRMVLSNHLLRNGISLQLSVMSLDKLLNLEHGGIAAFKVLSLGREYFSYRVYHVLSDVVVAECLKHLSRKWLPFELRRVDEVAVVSY